MFKPFKKVSAVAFCFLFVSLLLAGCGSSGSSTEPSPASSGSTLSVGQKLYTSDGAEFGTIVSLEDSHQFENGAVEPGALVDYGPRIPGTPPQWLPQRSALRMAR